MPDPRLPQRPQGRQPAPQPQKGPAKEKPTPQDPKTEIHVGDLEVVGRGNTARPVRMLDPSQQAPPVEVERKIRKGEAYWIVGDMELRKPIKGKIVRISNEPGKTIGIEFDEPVGGVDESGGVWGVHHNCDGHGKLGHCLYVRPDQVLDEKSMESHKAYVAKQEEETPKFDEYEEFTVSPQHSQPLTPPMENGGFKRPSAIEADEDDDDK